MMYHIPTVKRSPRTSDAGNINLAYYILPGGTASNYLVHYSYGKSPDTDWYVNAYCVYPDGNVSNGVYGVTYSYGRSSPVTNGSINAWDVTSYGGSFVDGVYNSYGNCFSTLRTCTAPTTLGKSTLLVLSATTTSAMSAIPTELCSPDTEDDLSLHIAAWVISEAGEGNAGIVFNSINSYGFTRSPSTIEITFFNAWNILSSGNATTLSNFGNLNNSYGYILIHIRVYFLASITIL